ncbi:MAG TPA: sulfatase-like hydrolase/transferase [Anaerolineales bacterium]
MPRKIPFHPVLFAVFPVLNYWLLNKDVVLSHSTWRTLGVCAVSALMLQAIFSMLLQSLDRGAFLASLLVVIFLYFGQTYYSISAGRTDDRLSHIFLAGWLSLLLFGSYLILRKRKAHPGLSNTLNLVSIVLLIVPIFGTARARWEHQTPQHRATNELLNYAASPQAGNQLPDIYYIVLDSYGRGDVLSKLYGLDNSGFLDALRARGFYVAEEGHANYIQTTLSLGSALDAGYFDPAQFTSGSKDRTGFQSYLDNTQVLKTLRQWGYEIDSTQDAIDFLQLDVSDKILGANQRVNTFQLGFDLMTLDSLWDHDLYDYKLWQLVQAQLDGLESPWLASGPPHFVFAHILSPHPPFSFDARGNFVPSAIGQNGHTNIPESGRAEYISGYRTQVQYLNYRVIEILDHIQSHTDRTAIILLQGDHGPGVYLDFSSAANSCLQERFSILNAYYFPDAATQARLYPVISPVNTFRLVFSELLGKTIPFLDDRSYFSTWDKPYEFLDNTDTRDTCSPLKK